MPLGLAKDSMINLAEMAEEKEEKEERTGIDISAVTLKDGVGVVRVEASDDSFQDIGDLEEEVDDLEDREQPDELQSMASSNDDVSAASGASPTPALSTMNASNNNSASSVIDSYNNNNQASSHGQYAGFASGYEDYTSYGAHNAPTLLGGKPQANNFWCCVFPWMQNGEADVRLPSPSSPQNGASTSTIPGSWHQEPESSQDAFPNKDASAVSSSIRSLQDDDVSTGSGVFGEKLSEKEKQAVLARLRLAQPDFHTQSSPANAADAASEAEQQQQKQQQHASLVSNVNGGSHPGTATGGKTGQGGVKGILRHTASAASTAAMLQGQASNKSNGAQQGKRRSLFPQYAVDAAKKEEKKNLKVAYASMARVVAVKSKNDMDESEKGDVWWQKSDYEEFRKTGRMITKAMLDGGSEIWLASSASWRLPDQNKASTLKHAMALSERQKNGAKSTTSGERSRQAKEDYEAARDKWWHAFGHSRRGLEHVASSDEGRQRQNNVRSAIRAVVEEQRRQKVFHRQDADKLRMVSIQHSLWARDLALASAASDADAVRANFDDSHRKTREFYLLKFSRSHTNAGESSSEAVRSNIPAFMKPTLSMPVAGNRLDANTVSQIRYRKTQQLQQHQQLQRKMSLTKMPMTPAPPPKAAASPSETSVKDDASSGGESMAKRAAGYVPGQNAANMSAVLTGMGPLPKNTATVGGP
jgi:hypothetical protein